MTKQEVKYRPTGHTLPVSAGFSMTQVQEKIILFRLCFYRMKIRNNSDSIQYFTEWAFSPSLNMKCFPEINVWIAVSVG